MFLCTYFTGVFFFNHFVMEICLASNLFNHEFVPAYLSNLIKISCFAYLLFVHFILKKRRCRFKRKQKKPCLFKFGSVVQNQNMNISQGFFISQIYIPVKNITVIYSNIIQFPACFTLTILCKISFNVFVGTQNDMSQNSLLVARNFE